MVRRSGGGGGHGPRPFSAALIDKLAAHARQLAKLGVTDDQGTTRAETLRRFEQRTGKRHQDLDVPPCPDAMGYLLRWWRELDAGRSAKGPLTHTDIAAWCAMTGRRLTQYELRAIRAIDAEVMQVAEEAIRKAAK